MEYGNRTEYMKFSQSRIFMKSRIMEIFDFITFKNFPEKYLSTNTVRKKFLVLITVISVTIIVIIVINIKNFSFSENLIFIITAIISFLSEQRGNQRSSTIS